MGFEIGVGGVVEFSLGICVCFGGKGSESRTFNVQWDSIHLLSQSCKFLMATRQIELSTRLAGNVFNSHVYLICMKKTKIVFFTKLS